MERNYSHYIYLAVVVILAVLAILILKSYLTALILGAIFAYWFTPLHRKLSGHIRPLPSAIVISVALFLVVMSVMQYGLYLLLRELNKVAGYFQSLDVSKAVYSIFGIEFKNALTLKSIGSKVVASITSDLSEIIYSLPLAIIGMFVFIMVFFYLLKDGERLYGWIKQHIPFPVEKRHHFVESIKNYADAFLKSELLIALTQGIVCAIGFYLFGLKDYMLLGGLAASLLSVLPIIGPYLLYTPVGVIIASQGNVTKGIGIIIYGLAIGSLLDYIVRPNLTGKYAKMHPLLVLIGILGGFEIFGVAGIFVGPIVLGICTTLIGTLGEKKARRKAT